MTAGLLGLVFEWAESTLMCPRLVGRQVQLHPLIVLLAIPTAASLMGIVAAIMSAPLAAALICVAEEFYLEPFERTGTDSARFDSGSMKICVRSPCL